MSCESCVQKILAANEAERKLLEQAVELAQESGGWVALYRNELGELRYIRADQAAGYPVIEYLSPKLPDTTA